MCTGIRFTDKNGAMYFGRNLDWTQGYGEKVVVTPSAADFILQLRCHSVGNVC